MLFIIRDGISSDALNDLGSSCDGRLEEVTVVVDDVFGALGSL